MQTLLDECQYREITLNSYLASQSVGTYLNSDASSTQTFQVQPSMKIRGFRLKSASIPISQYVVNSNNNSLTFEEQSSAATTRVATLTVGNYAGAQLASSLASSLTSAGTQTYTCSYSAVTNQITITASSNFRIKPSASWYILGIGQNSTSSYSTTFTTGNMDLSGVKTILVSSNELQGATQLMDSKNVLGIVMVSNNVSNVATYFDNSNFFFETEMNLSTLTISLYDEFNQPLNLQGKNYIITIALMVE